MQDHIPMIVNSHRLGLLRRVLHSHFAFPENIIVVVEVDVFRSNFLHLHFVRSTDILLLCQRNKTNYGKLCEVIRKCFEIYNFNV